MDGAGSPGFEEALGLRPSSASRRSVTPTAPRERLCKDILSICMRAGDIFSSGDKPSARVVGVYEDLSNAAMR